MAINSENDESQMLKQWPIKKFLEERRCVKCQGKISDPDQKKKKKKKLNNFEDDDLTRMILMVSKLD